MLNLILKYKNDNELIEMGEEATARQNCIVSGLVFCVSAGKFRGPDKPPLSLFIRYFQNLYLVNQGFGSGCYCRIRIRNFRKPGSGSGTEILKSLDLDPEFSNDLDTDPDSYFVRPGSQSIFI